MEVDRATCKKVVLFDVFGTLLDLDDDPHDSHGLESMAHWLSERGYGCAPYWLDSVLTGAKDELLSSVPFPCPDIDVRDAFRMVLDRIRPSTDRPHSLIDDMARAFRSATTRSLSEVKGVTTAVRHLAAKHRRPFSDQDDDPLSDIRIGIVSNTQRAYTEWELDSFNLLGCFEHIVFSSDVLSCKPCPRPFMRALDLFDVDAKSVIYVGDNPVDDVLGASQLGMRTILIERDDRSGWMTDAKKALSREDPDLGPDAIVRASTAAQGIPRALSELVQNAKEP